MLKHFINFSFKSFNFTDPTFATLIQRPGGSKWKNKNLGTISTDLRLNSTDEARWPAPIRLACGYRAATRERFHILKNKLWLRGGMVAGRSFPWSSHLRGRKVNFALQPDVAAIRFGGEGEKKGRWKTTRRSLLHRQCHRVAFTPPETQFLRTRKPYCRARVTLRAQGNARRSDVSNNMIHERSCRFRLSFKYTCLQMHSRMFEKQQSFKKIFVNTRTYVCVNV